MTMHRLGMFSGTVYKTVEDAVESGECCEIIDRDISYSDLYDKILKKSCQMCNMSCNCRNKQSEYGLYEQIGQMWGNTDIRISPHFKYILLPCRR